MKHTKVLTRGRAEMPQLAQEVACTCKDLGMSNCEACVNCYWTGSSCKFA